MYNQQQCTVSNPWVYTTNAHFLTGNIYPQEYFAGFEWAITAHISIVKYQFVRNAYGNAITCICSIYLLVCIHKTLHILISCVYLYYVFDKSVHAQIYIFCFQLYMTGIVSRLRVFLYCSLKWCMQLFFIFSILFVLLHFDLWCSFLFSSLAFNIKQRFCAYLFFPSGKLFANIFHSIHIKIIFRYIY